MRNRVTAVIGLCAAIIAATLFPISLRASDVSINPSSAVYRISSTPLTWGVSGGGGFNNNFYFTPLHPSEYVCVYVYNNNTTSGHGFAANIISNANALNKTPSDATWSAVSGATAIPIGAAPSQPGIIGAYVSGAALVSVNLSASSTQTGSPDNANVILIQTTSACNNQQGTQFAGYESFKALPPILAQSDINGKAFFYSFAQTNPTGNSVINVTASNGAIPKQAYWDRAIVSCTAICIISVNETGTAGTCTPDSVQSQSQNQNGATSAYNVGRACTVEPTTTAGITFNLAANTPYQLDLKGFTTPGSTGFGMAIFAASFTGTVNATLAWWER